MNALFSERNIILKIHPFDLKSEKSEESEKNNSLQNSESKDKTINNPYSKSVNIICKEENPYQLNPKMNLTVNQSFKKISNYVFPSNPKIEEEEEKQRSINKAYIYKLNKSISYSSSSEKEDYKDSISKSEKSESESNTLNYYCLVCENKLTIEELKNNNLDCPHRCCDSCYYEHLKEKINTNNIDQIKCLKVGCDVILFDDFIQKHLINDIPLLEKYLKFKKRNQLMLDPNIQLCPHPNCESYAKTNDKNNYYVTCLEGHKFCFKCLKNWHGKEKCKIDRDSKFEKWKNSKNVKKCPRCKYFIEKNEGCNHMTCINCKFEWCWLCLKESLPGHYDEGGNCQGLQFTKCQCFSSRFCVLLYHFILNLLGILKFIFLTPAILAISAYKIFEKINGDVNGFFIFFSVAYFCFIILIYVMSVVFIISFVMIFCWPLTRKISELYDEKL